MTRYLGFIAAVLLALLLVGTGAWLTYFGLGAGGGSTSRSWATIGPLLAGFGVALIIVCVKNARLR